MAYKVKTPKAKESKEIYKLKNLNQNSNENNKIPYQSDVKTFANPQTKEIMWIKREDSGKGWTNTYVNGKLVEKSRNPKSTSYLIPNNFKEVSLFSEMSYHSGFKDKGKITNYGTEDYTLEYSDYKPIGKYKLQSPLKTQTKEEFGKVKNDVELQEWNYVVLDWKPNDKETKLQIRHKISTPYGEEKEIYKSKEYNLSERKKAISDFKDYVKKIK